MIDFRELGLIRANRTDSAALYADVTELTKGMGLLAGSSACFSGRVGRIGGAVTQVKRRLDLVVATE